jgi:hypothetical protein
MQQSSISYSWRKRDASQGFTSGVSLHSDTCMSKETLNYLADMGTKFKLLRPIFANRERYCRDVHGFDLNYKASYWTPPLPPGLAFDLGRRQIENYLRLPALVSITDHDDIQATPFSCARLRIQAVCRSRSNGPRPIEIRCFISANTTCQGQLPSSGWVHWHNSLRRPPLRALRRYSPNCMRCRTV